VWVASERSGYLDERSTVRAFDLDARTGRDVCMVESVKESPVVSSRWVVWIDRRGDAAPFDYDAVRELYCYDLASGQERRLTRDANPIETPAIDGDLVVWADWPERSTSEGGASEGPAVALDLASGARRDFLVPGARAFAPIVSEGWVAWWSIEPDTTTEEMSWADVRLAEFSSGEVRDIEVDVPQPLQYQPLGLAMDAPWFAWQRITGPHLGEGPTAGIALTSAEGRGERIVSGETSDDSFLTYPAVSGENVVWYEGSRTGERRGAIFACELEGGTPRRLCRADVGPGGIAAGGDWVAWAQIEETAKGEGECDIVAFNLATDERRVVCAAKGDQWSPQITGEWVVWEDARNSTARGDARTWDIYAFNLETGEELAVCTDPGNQGWLSVSR
jgi:beta propeller repeat protein